MNKEKVERIDSELEVLREQVTRLVELKIKESIDIDIYDEEYNRLNEEIENLRDERLRYTKAELEYKNKIENIKKIEKVLKKQDTIETFNEDLFNLLIEKVIVISAKEVKFILKGGVEKIVEM